MISILMPVFNAASFLKACLNSIREQSLKDWELLAVDDHSTDNSAVILTKFAAMDNRIHFLKNKKKGIIPALRLAFEHSGGDFITRMDADDLMPVDKLAHLHTTLLEKGPGHVVTGTVNYFSDTGLGDGYKKYESWLNGLVLHHTHFKELYRECVLPSPAWLIHRTDLIAAGAFNGNRYPEDYDLCFRFFEQGFKIVGIPETVHLWRDHPDRTSRNDPTYADQNYLDLKLYWFTKLHYDTRRPFAIWGAGKKGKLMARYFLEQSLSFHWITDNSKKQGINIYDQILTAPEALFSKQTNLIIGIAVATPSAREEIENFLHEKNKQEGVDYFWFC